MYQAVLAIVVGQGLFLGSAPLLRYAAFVWLVFHVVVLVYEEPTLADQFQESYAAYRRNVRRWWPRVKPWRG
jgi:protein-S-isoprenylcysteine O-methyltransferase Ste14